MANDPRQQLGDAPIAPEYRAIMRDLAKTLDVILNGEAGGADRQTGFVLLVFPFGDDPKGRCNYISNGADRRDIVALFREQIKRFEGQPDVEGRA